jgi:hypothetical protein
MHCLWYNGSANVHYNLYSFSATQTDRYWNIKNLLLYHVNRIISARKKEFAGFIFVEYNTLKGLVHDFFFMKIFFSF